MKGENKYMKPILYTADWCQACPAMKRKLDDMGVEYDIFVIGDEMPPKRVKSLPTLGFPSIGIFLTGVRSQEDIAEFLKLADNH